jgi:hypothetical protein
VSFQKFRTFVERHYFSLFLGIIGVLMVSVAPGFGITWDEPGQSDYGITVLKYFQSGFKDRSSFTFGNFYIYGGFFDGFAALLVRSAPFLWAYDVRHIFNSLLGWLGIVYAARLAKDYFSPAAGMLTAILLVCWPVYFGHSMNNPKDIPFAAFYVMGLYYILKVPPDRPLLTANRYLAILLSIVGAMNIRVGGLLLVAYFAMFVFWRLVNLPKPQPRDFLKNGLYVLVLVPMVLVLGTAFWPWAQWQPIWRPLLALRELSHFAFDGLVLFDGQMVRTENLPWNYLPQWLLVQTPIVVLVLIVAALISVKLQSREERTRFAALWFAALFPILYIIGTRAVIYDATRHILFTYPPIAAIAGIGGAKIWETLRPTRTGVALAFALLIGGLFGPVSYAIRNHPYEYVYYNEFVGGTRGAFKRYELDYWGTCLKDSVHWVSLQSEKEGRRLSLGSAEPTSTVQIYADHFPGISFIGSTREGDYYTTLLRYSPAAFDALLNGEDVVYRVEADGAPLCIVTKKNVLRETPGPQSASPKKN